MASVLTGSAEHAEHAKQGGRAAWGCRAEAQHTRQLTHAKCLWDTALLLATQGGLVAGGAKEDSSRPPCRVS